jgi:hypothetical protein
MTQLEIRSISGGTLPINVYACDVYQNQCILFGSINTTVPPVIVFTLPEQFDNVPAIGILLRDASGCERFEVAVCGDSGVTKIFQNIDDDYVFQFMDFIIYQYEGPN